MEKLIRCYRYAIVPIQRFGVRESRLDGARFDVVLRYAEHEIR